MSSSDASSAVVQPFCGSDGNLFLLKEIYRPEMGKNGSNWEGKIKESLEQCRIFFRLQRLLETMIEIQVGTSFLQFHFPSFLASPSTPFLCSRYLPLSHVDFLSCHSWFIFLSAHNNDIIPYWMPHLVPSFTTHTHTQIQPHHPLPQEPGFSFILWMVLKMTCSVTW